MRTGLVAKKIGMSRLFQSNGTNIPVTILKVDNLKVIDKRTVTKHGYNALKLSYGGKNKINKPQIGFFKKTKLDSSSNTVEFRVSEDGFMEIGTEISVNHLLNGQYVDVTGHTIGKGFAGGMKRHNFAGNRATHGVSISHRSHGSTGQCQDPGKVFKGKKMAGRLGNVKRTMQNLKVMQTNINEGLIILKGSIPGPKGLTVLINDSVKKKNKDLPYPTNSITDSIKTNITDVNSKSSNDISNENNTSPPKTDNAEINVKDNSEANADKKSLKTKDDINSNGKNNLLDNDNKEKESNETKN